MLTLTPTLVQFMHGKILHKPHFLRGFEKTMGRLNIQYMKTTNSGDVGTSSSLLIRFQISIFWSLLDPFLASCFIFCLPLCSPV